MGDGMFTMTQFPQRDEGTHEHSQSDGPITVAADDVTNAPVDDAQELPAEVVTDADDVTNETTGEVEGVGVTTFEADWPKGPAEADDKDAADNKAAPVRKPASKRSTKG